MTVMTESRMTRNSYTVLFRHTSADTTGIADTSTQAPVLRNVGGSTVATSSEGTCKFDVSDRIGFLVGWACTAVSTGYRLVRVNKGDMWRGEVGNLDIELTPTSSGSTGASQVKILAGPYECARFALKATSTDPGVSVGQNYIKFSVLSDASSDAQAQYVQIKPFRWADVQYAT